MRLIYCTKCRFVANIEIESRMSLTLVCNCPSELQKLAARAEDGLWYLADRAGWATIPDDVFDRVNEQCRAAMAVGAGRG